MNDQNSETEVKFYAPDLKALAQTLEAIGAKLTVPRIYERNVRYEDATKTLSERGIVVRLRQDSRVRLTYKEPPASPAAASNLSYRYEAEVEVSDFATMELILGKLGYHPYLVYEKYRTTYEIDEAEIVLDEMPYGNFIEIEGAPEAIEQVIVKLGLQDKKRYVTNYIRLFENVQNHLGIKLSDLTFAHFEGITVPQSSFEPVSGIIDG